MRLTILLTVIFLLIVALSKEKKNEVASPNYSAKNTEITTSIDNNKYPEDVASRETYIRTYLAENYTVEELPNEVIENLIRIAKKESSAHDPLIEPRTTVFHCKDDKWFVVENMVGCPEGSVSGRKEKSIGVFQILPSTWNGYKCEGDMKNVDDQLDCGVKIWKRSGYYPWFNSSKKLGLI